jgi:hypothetical protein
MARRKAHKPTGTLQRFVARAISDRSTIIWRVRMQVKSSRAFAKAAIAAVKRGRAKGLR